MLSPMEEYFVAELRLSYEALMPPDLSELERQYTAWLLAERHTRSLLANLRGLHFRKQALYDQLLDRLLSWLTGSPNPQEKTMTTSPPPTPPPAPPPTRKLTIADIEQYLTMDITDEEREKGERLLSYKRKQRDLYRAGTAPSAASDLSDRFVYLNINDRTEITRRRNADQLATALVRAFALATPSPDLQREVDEKRLEQGINQVFAALGMFIL